MSASVSIGETKRPSYWLGSVRALLPVPPGTILLASANGSADRRVRSA